MERKSAMPDNKPDNPPAFARPASTVQLTEGVARILPQAGMTLRDFFAAAALQGLLANPTIYPKDHDKPVSAPVEIAFAYADRMLKEREIER